MKNYLLIIAMLVLLCGRAQDIRLPGTDHLTETRAKEIRIDYIYTDSLEHQTYGGYRILYYDSSGWLIAATDSFKSSKSVERISRDSKHQERIDHEVRIAYTNGRAADTSDFLRYTYHFGSYLTTKEYHNKKFKLFMVQDSSGKVIFEVYEDFFVSAHFPLGDTADDDFFSHIYPDNAMDSDVTMTHSTYKPDRKQGVHDHMDYRYENGRYTDRFEYIDDSSDVTKTKNVTSVFFGYNKTPTYVYDKSFRKETHKDTTFEYPETGEEIVIDNAKQRSRYSVKDKRYMYYIALDEKGRVIRRIETNAKAVAYQPNQREQRTEYSYLPNGLMDKAWQHDSGDKKDRNPHEYYVWYRFSYVY